MVCKLEIEKYVYSDPNLEEGVGYARWVSERVRIEWETGVGWGSSPIIAPPPSFCLCDRKLLNVCLFVFIVIFICFGFIVPLENFSLICRRHHYG